MANNYTISIEDIKNAPSGKLQFTFENTIEEISPNSIIKANLEANWLGEFIEIKGKVKGLIKLECDLCLEEFEYELDFDVDEVFAQNALMSEYGQETELKDGQFITDLEGKQEIDIYDLLYQSVILDLPNKKVCGINCKGSGFESEESFLKNQTDPRLDVFKNIDVKKK